MKAKNVFHLLAFNLNEAGVFFYCSNFSQLAEQLLVLKSKYRATYVGAGHEKSLKRYSHILVYATKPQQTKTGAITAINKVQSQVSLT
jgi:hypothetical protein